MRVFLSVAAAIGVAAFLAAFAGARAEVEISSRVVASCDRSTSPGPGAAERLVESLREGEVGCLRSGIYRETIAIRRDGITLAGAPGARATILGRVIVRGDDVTLAHLTLDGRNAKQLPSPTILGDRVRLAANEITNRHTAICVNIGSVSERITAHRTLVERNRIHHCGRLPRTNHDHGIYVERSRDARIVDNVIYMNADRGVQLYPDADFTLVARNVIDSNGSGVIVSGDHGATSAGNRIVGNVITNSIRANVESWWPRGNPVGRGNVVTGNCLWGGSRGGLARAVGFVARGNVVAEPEYVNSPRGDFRIRAGACRGKGPR